MAEMILFKPRAEVDAEDNMHAFVDLARTKLTKFGVALNFDDDSWDVTEDANLKARSCKLSLRFTGFPSGRGQRDGSALPEPFKSFAKAYLRYTHAISNAKVASHEMAAVRAIAQALKEALSEPSPVFADAHHFQRASQILADRYAGDACYHAQAELERMSEFLTENRISTSTVVWRKPSSVRNRNALRVGAEFDAKRNAKLPDPIALSAIAEIFRKAKDPSDIFVTSMCAILSSAPSRINEAMHLAVDCEVYAKNAKGEDVYGLRWRASKGGGASVKWVITSMASVTQEAVAKLSTLSEDARKVALWYEQNPTRLYLPEHLEHLRHKPRLTNREVSEIIFKNPPNKLKPEQVGSKWCLSQKIPSKWEGGSPAQGGCNTVAFEDVENAVLALLPRGFPVANKETGLRYSEALCLTLRNELTATLGTYRCSFVLADAGAVRARLVGTKSVKTIFEKFRYTDQNGQPLRINSHQFRHYLNTLAQMGGIDQMDIAKWSGRANVAQNAVYNHQSDRDVLALVKSAIGEENKIFGPLAHTPKNTLITRDQFASLRVLTAHTTDFGYCLHDFSMTPCQVHRDCLNCDEQVCIKGDAPREQSIRFYQKETKLLLAKAREALTDEEFGANRWVDHQSKTLARLDQLCAILDDPLVPNGAVIQPAGVVPASRIDQAASQRKVNTEGRPLPSGTPSLTSNQGDS